MLPDLTPVPDRNHGYAEGTPVMDHDALRLEARRIADYLAAMHEARVENMKAMAAAGMTWAEIGRIWQVSPQAAMYATGHATRTRDTSATKKPAAAKKATPKKPTGD